MNETQVVFGAGQVGLQLADRLAATGTSVRLVRRSAPGAPLDGVTWMQGDATDRAFVDEACRGATVVYNCANPPDYTRWDGVLQPLTRAIWQAAGRANARLVHLDNLYMYGMPQSGRFDAQTPLNPCSAKGKIRAELVHELFEAHARGDVAVTSGRASDYFGAHTVYGAVFRPDVYRRILKGGTVWVFGNPDVPHSYAYTPDVARGLATLGENPTALGRAWLLPTSARGTTRQLFDRFAARAGTSVVVRRVPRWILRGIGVVSPLVSALVEMDHQWEHPFVVDDGDFCRTFSTSATPLDDAIDETLRAHGMAAALDAAPAAALS